MKQAADSVYRFMQRHGVGRVQAVLESWEGTELGILHCLLWSGCDGLGSPQRRALSQRGLRWV